MLEFRFGCWALVFVDCVRCIMVVIIILAFMYVCVGPDKFGGFACLRVLGLLICCGFYDLMLLVWTLMVYGL